jgi:hypothetical protein
VISFAASAVTDLEEIRACPHSASSIGRTKAGCAKKGVISLIHDPARVHDKDAVPMGWR